MSTNLRLDHSINKIENKLSYYAAYPVLGTAAGAVKIILGSSQVIAGIVVSALALIPATLGKTDLLKYSWTHLKHGLGNIVAGTLEALPIVGTVMLFARFNRHPNPCGDCMATLVRTYHEEKWMAYESLVERDWRFSAFEEEEEPTAFRAKYNEKLIALGAVNLTLSQRLQIAESVLR